MLSPATFQSLLGPHPRLARWAWIAHLLTIAGAIVWFLLICRHNAPHEGLADTASWLAIPGWVIGLWLFMSLAMAALPLRPAFSLLFLACWTTLVARYESGIDITLNTAMVRAMALMSLTGTLAWAIRKDVRWQWPSWRHGPFWILPALIGWILLCGLVAQWRTGHWAPDPAHHPIQFVSISLFFVMACCFAQTPAINLAMSLTMIIALSVRGRLLSPQGIYLHEDIASLLAMTLPMGLLAIKSLPARWYRKPVIGLVILITLHNLWLIWHTQNRAAGLGVIVAVVTLWATSRHRLLTGLAAGASLAIGAVLLHSTAYWQRFQDLLTGGRSSDSAVERLVIWKAAWQMFIEHPWFGVGPGHFFRQVLGYEPSLPSALRPHNHLMAMLAETGWIGALLYFAFFGWAILLLIRTLHICRTDWPAPAARCLLASLMVYLTIGSFITRHDLLLAYVLAGWAVSLHSRLESPAMLVLPDER